MDFTIQPAGKKHLNYADEISSMMQLAARQRGTGIANRSAEYIQSKMTEGKAVIALHKGRLAGFCYIESWSHHKYVANSGLIVHSDYRKTGLARRIKRKIFDLSREKYPDAKIFGITTSLPVMKINSDLGYKPVTFSELTTDEEFWKGCQSCKNYDILTRTSRNHCLCTGMLFDPEKEVSKSKNGNKYDRWQRFVRFLRWHRIRAYRKTRKFKNLTKEPA